MRSFACACGNTLYFENSSCVSCQREVGWCPECHAIRALMPVSGNAYTCEQCHASLVKCANYATHHVCNRMVVASSVVSAEALCNCCQYTETTPNLSVPGNIDKWRLLEAAKRRLLYNLDLLKLPYGTAAQGFVVPLSFDFLEDVFEQNLVKGDGPIMTGHANGKITINSKEANPVEREKQRVQFGEPHRTLIGHFHHEIGHYYWQLLVQNRCEDACMAVFGNHNFPSYAQALETYYVNGFKTDWSFNYISAYATMHPWEDFAETFGAYLDMTAVLDTANYIGFSTTIDYTSYDEFAQMLLRYEQLGIKINEMNRTIGLQDLVPEVFTAGVVAKMRFIHEVVKQASTLIQSPAERF